MSKLKKIDIFLIIGFFVSAFSFSLTISNIHSVYSEVVEKNSFYKDYKYIDVDVVEEYEIVDGYKVINNEEDSKEEITLKDVIDNVNNIGYEKVI